MSSDLNTRTETDLAPSEPLSEKKKSYLHSRNAVYRALIANIGISTIKFLCWFLSGSTSLLSEAIHSLADGFNSFCLIVGLKEEQNRRIKCTASAMDLKPMFGHCLPVF
jgi:Co/Zn/Cd efflux system component